MIAFLTGRVVAKGADHCFLDVNGVGFKLLMSTSALTALPSVGDDVTVSTYLHVREDELTLFGFESEQEKHAFEQLITVSGVGPKVALSTLSALSPSEIYAAVSAGDVAVICSVPGIGKKTAQRMILDLGDRLAPADGSDGAGGVRTGGSAVVAEATSALLGMGFSSAEVAAALSDSGEAGSDAQSLLRHALRRLGGG